MSYWFHLNPFKATTKPNFSLKLIYPDEKAIRICSRLEELRKKLVEIFEDLKVDIKTSETILEDYLSLLIGFIDPIEGKENTLRYLVKYKWSQSVTNTEMIENDALFELISILQEFGLFLMKKASLIALKEDLDDIDYKNIHIYLRKAAGIFDRLKNEFIPKFKGQPPQGSDMDVCVMEAYYYQCIAEAEEVTISKAIQHSPSLISGLASEASQTFLKAFSSIKSMDLNKFGKWTQYLKIKYCIYQAYAYSFCGSHLLSEEKAGDAIKCLTESESIMESIKAMQKNYFKVKGTGNAPKLEQTLFFHRIKMVINRIKDKCERENNLLYHQKVSQELPSLTFKATHGIVEPIAFDLPTIHSDWNLISYSSFITKADTEKRNFHLSTKRGDSMLVPEVDSSITRTSAGDLQNNHEAYIRQMSEMNISKSFDESTLKSMDKDKNKIKQKFSLFRKTK